MRVCLRAVFGNDRAKCSHIPLHLGILGGVIEGKGADVRTWWLPRKAVAQCFTLCHRLCAAPDPAFKFLPVVACTSYAGRSCPPYTYVATVIF